MPVYYPKRATQCPCCATWVEETETCSWCTVNLRTGSWQDADMTVAVRELRHHWSAHEFGPTKTDELLARDRAVPQCGTETGYRAHRRRGEVACPDCRLARMLLRREQRAAGRVAA